MDKTLDDIKQLEYDLEHEEEDLRQDLTKIKSKIEETKEGLSPSKIIRQKLFYILGLALALGFALGYHSYSLRE